MRSYRISTFAFLLSLILSGIFIVNAYSQELSKAELEKRADSYFKKEKFDKSAADFKILHEMYPKELRYAYFLGRSYFGANQELESAINLLKFAAIRNYGSDSYFYLGRAYHLTYQFDDAIMSFKTFNKTAKSKDRANCEIDYWLQVAENAKAAVLMAQKVTIEEINEIKRSTPEIGFATNVDGKYIYVPDELKSKTDLSKDYQSLLFLSENIEVGDYIYFDCLVDMKFEFSFFILFSTIVGRII